MRLTGGVLRGGDGHCGRLLGVFFLEEKTCESNTDWSGAGTGDFMLVGLDKDTGCVSIGMAGWYCGWGVVTVYFACALPALSNFLSSIQIWK